MADPIRITEFVDTFGPGSIPHEQAAASAAAGQRHLIAQTPPTRHPGPYEGGILVAKRPDGAQLWVLDPESAEGYILLPDDSRVGVNAMGALLRPGWEAV